ncbi:sulfiredoxin, chloroplastic/mitochondrial isoform X3 [Mercurialis annua]|uniref:sulfiredoxin, chloroplastic/mitochondrial isoform X3 n=1 Tax=Mercurialis annua TaxID=3986 RepID=UPI00215FA5BD|nr:sulfiredoxin, chloroplastic/mitochondrial isoform X3 [Mercurialis annua]
MGSFVMKIGGASRLRNLSISASSNGNEKTGPLILEVALDKIRRPLMRTRANDPIKVQYLMDSIQQIGLQVPDAFLQLRLIFWRLHLHNNNTTKLDIMCMS